MLLSTVTLALVLPLSSTRPEWFAPYFGAVPAWAAALAVLAAGCAALVFLDRSRGFLLLDAELTARERMVPAVWALPFMLTVTLVDSLRGFPADINVPWPAAWIFYPGMALIAQLALHVVPFALLLLLLESVWPSASASRRTWVAIVVVALLEGALQVSGGRSDDPVLAAFVVLQLTGFGIVELDLYRRHDYLAMITFRLTYYLWWHILWGLSMLS